MSSMLIHVMVAYLLQLVSLPQISWILFGIGNRHIPWPPWQHPRIFFGHTLNGSAQALLLGCKKEAISGGNTSSAHRISLWRWWRDLIVLIFTVLGPSKSPIAWLLVYLPTRGFCWSLSWDSAQKTEKKWSMAAWHNCPWFVATKSFDATSLDESLSKNLDEKLLFTSHLLFAATKTYCETAWRTVMLESMEFQRKVIGKDPQKSKYVMYKSKRLYFWNAACRCANFNPKWANLTKPLSDLL